MGLEWILFSCEIDIWLQEIKGKEISFSLFQTHTSTSFFRFLIPTIFLWISSNPDRPLIWFCHKKIYPSPLKGWGGGVASPPIAWVAMFLLSLFSPRLLVGSDRSSYGLWRTSSDLARRIRTRCKRKEAIAVGSWRCQARRPWLCSSFSYPWLRSRAPQRAYVGLRCLQISWRENRDANLGWGLDRGRYG